MKLTEENAIIIDDSVNPATYSLELHCKDAIEAADQREQILENHEKAQKFNWLYDEMSLDEIEKYRNIFRNYDEIEKNKQKLEKIKMFFAAHVNSQSGEYLSINTAKLKEILEENK